MIFDEDALFYDIELSHRKMKMQEIPNRLHLNNGNGWRNKRRHDEEPLRMEENTNIEMTLVEGQQLTVSTTTTTTIPVATTKVPPTTSTVPKALPTRQTTTTPTIPVLATTISTMDSTSASKRFSTVNNKGTTIRNDGEPISHYST